MRGRTYQAWLLREADRDARRAGCRLVHYTDAFAPIRHRLPYVLTIQDLSLIRMPRAHPPPPGGHPGDGRSGPRGPVSS